MVMPCIGRESPSERPGAASCGEPLAGGQYDQAFELLPVLDLRHGQVVRARQGQRSSYAPIISPLVAGSAPADVLAALLARTAATRAYVADLDAILGEAPQSEVLLDLGRRFGTVELWVDAGFTSAAQARATLAAGCVPVLGTESLQGWEDLSGAHGTCVLSLDFGCEGFRGDARWLADAAAWPTRLVVMTLGQVGTGAGPDVERLRWARARAGARRIYAAGGVRDAADLDKLAALGVSGALVATALHDGGLGGHLPTASRR